MIVDDKFIARSAKSLASSSEVSSSELSPRARGWTMAAHSFFIGGAKKLTARDYVQDGLVAIFDVKDNSDWGVHDAGIRRVNNLVNPSEYLSFGEDLSGDHIKLVSYGISTNVGINSLGSYDAVLSSSNNSFWSSFISVGGYSVGSSTTEKGSPSFATVSRSGEKVVYFTSKRDVWDSVYNISEPSYVYRPCFRTDASFNVVIHNSKYDGVLATSPYPSQTRDVPQLGSVTVGTVQPFSSYFLTTLFWSLRIYERELNANEIAANYAVDKERFGLP